MIERAGVPRSKFAGSWSRLTTFDAGLLVPFVCEEVLPGDHFRYDVTAYIRLSTPLFPLFSNQRVDTFFFFCPNRLVWDNWVRFMGEQDQPTDPIDFTVPMISVPGPDIVTRLAAGEIFDHFGIPVQDGLTGVEMVFSALPFRMYNLIFNTWFRDQNIVAGMTVLKNDTTENGSAYFLARRAKSHDYFTSCLPWPQKFTAPTVPIGGMAPILGLGVSTYTAAATQAGVRETGGGSRTYDLYRSTNAASMHMEMTGTTVDATPAVYADLSQATGVAINVFRQAFMVQSLLERDARGGTRYVELIRSHFGVTSPDFRLQRPEYIGGGQTPLGITPIAQTAPSAGAPVGALGAAGTAAAQHSASYAATEHGFIIGLINVRSELAYQQGLHKMWSRLTRFDYYWPALAQLGEQAVLRREIYCVGIDAEDDLVFGYQERWHEYRTRTSEVTGKFRSGITGTLDAWHLAQYFDPAPTLNANFIQDDPDMDRVLAAAGLAVDQQYLADIHIKRTVVRPIPTYGTPAILGRF